MTVDMEHMIAATELLDSEHSSVFSRYFRKKCPDELIKSANKHNLNKTLTAFDLVVLGIGAVIGAGIFALAGTAAVGSSGHVGAGPALVISLILAAIACSFSALCYAEFASMIPVAGSAFTYTYATLGELAAWFIGWMLVLEYLIGNITVVSSWSSYLMNFIAGFPGAPEWLTHPPIWLIKNYSLAVETLKKQGITNPESHIPHLGPIPLCADIPSIIFLCFITYLLYVGIKESTRFTFAMVLTKLIAIALFIGVGVFYVRPENWTPFAPNGFHGIFVGAYLIFFAYIGFDAVSTAAEETKNPQRDMPIGIIGSLTICTLIYIALVLVLTGMLPLNQIDTHAPVAAAMSSIGQNWVAGLISVGAIAGLGSVLLVLQLGGTRVLYAMSRDKLLPSVFSRVHPKFKTPHVNAVLVGIGVIIGTLFLDTNAAAELCNIGTLSAFMLVCIGVMVLRKTDPNRERPFKTPFVPFVPILGVLTCLALIILGLPSIKTLIIFGIWIAIGLTFYFAYSHNKVTKHLISKKAKELKEKEKSNV